jgi:hypothetical protein
MNNQSLIDLDRAGHVPGAREADSVLRYGDIYFRFRVREEEKLCI